MHIELKAAVEILQDPGFRSRVRQKDPDALEQMGLGALVGGGEQPRFNVVTSTSDVTYVQMPPRPSSSGVLDADDLAHIQAAGATGSTSSIGSAGTASTLGTASGTVSSGGSAGSVGSAEITRIAH